MPFPFTARPLAAVVTSAAASLVLVLSACTPAPSASNPSQQTGTGLPGTHIHGLSVNAETGQVLLATHDGLFDLSTKPATKIGPSNDLMGFTTARDHSVLYASGHPGHGSNLPNPLGLIKSDDGGKTWAPLSRQGESDFHALTATRSGIVGFDGALRTSPDGKNWKTAAVGFQPAVLAGHADGNSVLATTTAGVQRSTDGGNTWQLEKFAPVMQFASFVTAKEAVGVEPGGAVHFSTDGGATWAPKGRITGEVLAVAATEGSDGTARIWAATATGLVVSTDGGAEFHPFAAG